MLEVSFEQTQNAYRNSCKNIAVYPPRQNRLRKGSLPYILGMLFGHLAAFATSEAVEQGGAKCCVRGDEKFINCAVPLPL